jgi:threonine dehydratase
MHAIQDPVSGTSEPLTPAASAGVTRASIEATYARIAPYLRETPILRLDAADFGMAAFPLVLKLEMTQHAGSFKSRGAFSNLVQRDIPPAGIVAASGGNHGAAVAFAARRLGAHAKIFVPTISSPAKIARIREAGADLVIIGDSYADALAASEEWRVQSGALAVHAFDDDFTIRGQGTLALELARQAPDVKTVFAAVGGGGLIAGIAAWFEGSDVDVIGVEPELAPTLTKALEAGKPVDAEAGSIAADSLAPRSVGVLPFGIAQRAVKRVLLVTDDEIRRAQQMLWSTVRVVVEPGGAAAFAALLAGKYAPAGGETVAIVLSGANTTAVQF